MQLNRFKIAIACLLGVSLAALLGACQQNSQSGAPQAVSPAAAGAQASSSGNGSNSGGIDGSGGDTLKSTPKQVRAAYDSVIASLPDKLKQIEGNLSYGKEQYDYRLGAGSYDFIASFIQPHRGSEEIEPGLSIVESPLIPAVKAKAITIEAQMDACPAMEELHDGAATGDIKSGHICISLMRLQKLPTRILKSEILLLLMHELSHIVGFDEDHAEKLQQMLALHPSIYGDFRVDDALGPLFQKCDVKKLDAEVDEMQKSPFWQARLTMLTNLLSGQQYRAWGPDTKKLEDRITIFADDAECAMGNRKFNRTGFNWHIGGDLSQELETHVTTSDVQDLTWVASVQVKTLTGVISQIEGLVGTDAQCSPKVLVANLLSEIPDILNVGCGHANTERFKAQIAHEHAILKAEN